MAITNQGKIDQLIIDNNSFDIDLPVDATPSIASLTVSGAISEGGTTLANKYAAKDHTHTSFNKISINSTGVGSYNEGVRINKNTTNN